MKKLTSRRRRHALPTRRGRHSRRWKPSPSSKPTRRRRRSPEPGRRRPKPTTRRSSSHPWRTSHSGVIVHGVRARLPLGVIAVGDAVDDALRLLVPDLLVVLDDIAEVVAAGVVGFAHAHAVVREVDVAVVAEEFRHGDGVDVCRGECNKGCLDGVAAACVRAVVEVVKWE